MNKLYCETHLTFVKRRICCKLISTYINTNRTYIKRQTNQSSKNAANRGRRLTRLPQGVGGQVNKHRKSLPCRVRCPAPLLQRTLVIFARESFGGSVGKHRVASVLNYQLVRNKCNKFSVGGLIVFSVYVNPKSLLMFSIFRVSSLPQLRDVLRVRLCSGSC